jgi:hypothetical protein
LDKNEPKKKSVPYGKPQKLDPTVADAIASQNSTISEVALDSKNEGDERHNTHSQIVPSDNIDLFITWVNENKEVLGWKADTCLL